MVAVTDGDASQRDKEGRFAMIYILDPPDINAGGNAIPPAAQLLHVRLQNSSQINAVEVCGLLNMHLNHICL